MPVWRFEAVEGKTNVYNVIAPTKCSNKYLGVAAECDNTDVKFYNRDDKSGKQQWIVAQDPENPNRYTLRAGGRKNCDVSFLSFSRPGPGIGLSGNPSSRDCQLQIDISTLPPVTIAPSCSRINALERDDLHSTLSIDHSCSSSNSELAFVKPNDVMKAEDNAEAAFGQEWYLKPVSGLFNTFNVVARNTNCRKKYVGLVGDDCDDLSIGFVWNNKERKAEWNIQKSPYNTNAYTLSAKWGSCPRVFMKSKNNFSDVKSASSAVSEETWFGVAKCSRPTEKIKIPSCVTFKNLGKKDNITYAAISKDCNNNDAFIVGAGEIDNDDFDGNWNIQKVEGHLNVFTIQISEKRGDCRQSYLSALGDCFTHSVGLVDEVDNSGNQWWRAIHVEGLGNAYAFEAVGRQSCDIRYLSAGPEATQLKLSDHMDEDYQWFAYNGSKCDAPEIKTFEFGGCQRITSLSEKALKDIYSYTKKCSGDDSETDRQNGQSLISYEEGQKTASAYSKDWDFVPVSGQENTYMITGLNRECGFEYLTVDSRCNKNELSFQKRDDTNSLQYFEVSHVVKEGDVFTIRAKGRDNCDRQYVTTHRSDPKLYLWKEPKWRSGWFGIKNCKVDPVDAIEVPQCAKVFGMGKMDGRNYLSGTSHSCNAKSYLNTPEADAQTKFTFNVVETKTNDDGSTYKVYNIIAQRPGCKRNYLSAAACFCQSYVDFWDRDDGSERQRWTIQKTAGGYTLKAGGRNARAYLATEKVGDQPHLWTENDGTGKQIWNFEHCDPKEPEPIVDDSDEGDFWYTNPKWNEWNYGPNWTGPSCNYPNADKGYRFWWNQRQTASQFNADNFKTDSNFRMWINFVRDDQFLKCLNPKEGSLCGVKPSAGSNLAFRGEDEGQAWEWVQLDEHKGWGAIRLVGTNLYLAPQLTACGYDSESVLVRPGSRIGLVEGLSYLTQFHWNGKRFRHVSGLWLKVDNKHRLVVGVRGGQRSIWQLIGPDEAPLENFPCVSRCGDEHLYTDVGEVDDGTEDIMVCMDAQGHENSCDQTGV